MRRAKETIRKVPNSCLRKRIAARMARLFSAWLESALELGMEESRRHSTHSSGPAPNAGTVVHSLSQIFAINPLPNFLLGVKKCAPRPNPLTQVLLPVLSSAPSRFSVRAHMHRRQPPSVLQLVR